MNCRYCKEPVGNEKYCEGCGARVSHDPGCQPEEDKSDAMQRMDFAIMANQVLNMPTSVLLENIGLGTFEPATIKAMVDVEKARQASE